MSNDTYKIIRFHQDADREVIETGLTLAEAQAHCNDESTHGGSVEDGTHWFDGYDVDVEPVEDDAVDEDEDLLYEVRGDK